MEIDFNYNIDPTSLKFYGSAYNIIHTLDFNPESSILPSLHGMRYYGSPNNKTCRFCGKTSPEVSFKDIAHVFPESIGNHTLASYYECDVCNHTFGQGIENDYAVFFQLFHTILQVHGKNGIPTCAFKVPCKKRSRECMKNCVRFSVKDGCVFLQKCREAQGQYVSIYDHSIQISLPIGKCNPIAVFKSIVKMAISVIPEKELYAFSNTIRWLLEPNHTNFYTNKRLLIRYEIIPRFSVVTSPRYMLFKRKNANSKIPYMLFHLTYGCLSLLIEVPSNEPTCSDDEFMQIPFPPIPFRTTSASYWDMTTSSFPKGACNCITLTFDSLVDCTRAATMVGNKCEIDFTKL